MTKSEVKKLEERIAKLDVSPITMSRPVISRFWHRSWNPDENIPWQFFVEMQLTGLELAEIRQLDMQKESSEEPALRDRWNTLIEAAELRAEKLGEKPWRDWFTYFKAHVWPKMNEPLQIPPGDERCFFWDGKIKWFNEYREQEAKH